MGILNVTPDSFSDGGACLDPARAVARARAIAEEGAGILDVGGESTRPGSEPVPLDEELARVLPVLDSLGGSLPLEISIDTRRAAVAAAAADRGATILNDTAALRDDPEIAAVAAERGLAVILMHRRGVPATMQRDALERPRGGDIVAEVAEFFAERIEAALAAGIRRDRLLLDPGIGFGKRAEENDRLIAGLARLGALGLPIVVGASRKSFLSRFDARPAAGRLAGSLAVAAACARRGAAILRVHDVAETVAFLRTLAAIEAAGSDDGTAAAGAETGVERAGGADLARRGGAR